MSKQLAKTDDQWRDYIGESMQKTVESIIETGKRIYEFKLDSESTSGGTNFPQRAKDVLGMSQAQSSKWAKIGANSDELIRNRISLPASKSVIDEILTMPDWKNKLEDITPRTTTDEVRAMKGTKPAGAKPKKEKKAPASSDVEAMYDSVDKLSTMDFVDLGIYMVETLTKRHKDGDDRAETAFGRLSDEVDEAWKALFAHNIHKVNIKLN